MRELRRVILAVVGVGLTVAGVSLSNAASPAKWVFCLVGGLLIASYVVDLCRPRRARKGEGPQPHTFE